jgi:hypothetical protein
MCSLQHDMSEQFSPARLLERTWTEFNRKCVSQGAIFVLWDGFENADELTTRYFQARGQSGLLDGRRRLSDEELNRVDGIKAFAEELVVYRNWAREGAGDPLLRDAVVAYCAAFESALKTIALAFRVVAEFGGSASDGFLPAKRLVALRREVRKSWEGYANARAEQFYLSEIYSRNPDPIRWPFEHPSTPAVPRLVEQKISPHQFWLDAAEAFKLRNKILHQGGYLDEQLEIADLVLPAGSDFQVDVRSVRRVHMAFRWLLSPINPEQF